MTENKDIKTLDFIPQLSEDIVIQEFDSNSFLVQQNKYKKNVRIGHLSRNALVLINGKRTIREIKNTLEKEEDLPIDPEALTRLICDRLASLGIVHSENHQVKHTQASYVHFQRTLLPERYLHRVSGLLGFLFSPRRFYVLFIGLISLTSFLVYQHLRTDYIFTILDMKGLLYLPVIMLTSLLFHELGHITACRKFGARHGDIGIGLYLIFPVFYADVSDVWKLEARKRIIVDLAGIFMELVFCALLSVLFLVTGNHMFLAFIILILLNTYKNINPFLRFDGYWALSDFMGIPNLREKSNEILTRAYNSIFDKSKITLRGKKDYALLLYGLSSWIFIIGIVSWMVLYHSDSIMHFPLTIAESIKTIYSNFNFQVLTLQLSELIVPTIFYFIMIRLVVKIIRNQEFQFPSKPSKYV